MGAHNAGVEDQDIEVRVAQQGKNRVPTTLGVPAIKASPDAVPLAKPLWQIGPRNTGSRDIQNSIDEEAIVLRTPTVLPRLPGQQGFDPLPICVGNRVSMQHEWPSLAQNRGPI
jgi:hypothetical protein